MRKGTVFCLVALISYPFLALFLAMMGVGCASTRTLNVYVQLDSGQDHPTTATMTVVTAKITDTSALPLVVGEPRATATAARTADGVTTGSATAEIGKATVGKLGTAGIGAVSGAVAAKAVGL